MDYRFLRFHVHDKYQEPFKKAFIEVDWFATNVVEEKGVRNCLGSKT